MTTFSDFDLPTNLADSLNTLGFTTPTPIQAQAIPHALQGRDVLGSAQTGTGKTGAFMIPMITKLLTDPTAKCLVMTPTRELATQVMDMTRKLMGNNSGLRTALLIGGEPMPKQFKQLNNRPRLIIGTPGRIDDHCRRNRDLLSDASYLVLDEADRMLDMGFSVQIDSILKYMPEQRQTLMFSATFSNVIVKFAQRYLNDPVRVEVKSDKITADKIKHDIVHTTTDRKFDQLQSELATRTGSVIIFVKTRRNADQLAKRLSYIEHDDFHAEPIHGDLRQRQRDRTISDFRSSKFRILVATDVASRGLDIPHIEHVINYDLPQNPEDYVHRIGRTARAGAEGQAICFLTPQDGRNWGAIQRLVFPDQAGPSNSNFERGSNKRNNGPKSFRNGGDRKKSFGRDRAQNENFGSERSRTFKGKSDDRDQGARFERKERPAFGERKERPAFGERNDRPFKKRDDAPRSDRQDRPAFGERNERNDRPFKKRDDAPRFERKERPAFGDRKERPAFGERNERNDRPFKKRDDAPRSDRKERPAFGERNERNDRPFNKRDDAPRFERKERPAFGERNERNDRPFKKRSDQESFGNRFEQNEGRADNPKNQRFNEQRPRPKFDGPKREGRSDGKKQGNWNGPKKAEGQRTNGDRPFKKRTEQGGFNKGQNGRPASQTTHRLKSRNPKRAA